MIYLTCRKYWKTEEKTCKMFGICRLGIERVDRYKKNVSAKQFIDQISVGKKLRRSILDLKHRKKKKLR